MTFDPTCQCGASSHDGRDHQAVLEWPSCHVCGRVLTEEDHTDEAGTDGAVYWCSSLHSREGLEMLAGVCAWLEFEQARVAAESEGRLQSMINEAVAEAMKNR